MDSIAELFARGVEQLWERTGGPLHFRFFLMPLVVAFLAVRAGMRDAREGRAYFLWKLLTHRRERPELLRSALRDVGRVLLTAGVLDTTYQIVVLRSFHPLQLLVVAGGCAVLPYLILRGPVALLMRTLHRWAGRTGR